jgi:hypothetical protein
MSNSGPLKVLGAIGAMQTFVENFPMSILDLMHGPTYTSVFMFLADVLQACGITLQEIAEYLISEVFGINLSVTGGVDALINAIDNLDVDEQSEFLESLEYIIKGVIMAILTAIFSCSAVPILPNKYMDTGKEDDWFDAYRLKCATAHSGKGLYIPSKLIDLFGYLNVSPFSREGKLYYSVEGGDKYYEKVQRTEFIMCDSDTVKVPKHSKSIQVYLTFGDGHADYVAAKNRDELDEIQFMISSPLGEDFTITVIYKDFDGNLKTRNVVIKSGYRDSELFLFVPTDWENGSQVIQSIRINNEESGFEYDENTYVYLDREKSNDVIKFWKSVGNNSADNIEWGRQSDETIEIAVSEVEEEEREVYEYIETGEIEDAVRMNHVPSNPDDSSPDYIVYYEGLDPNTLYKSYDMNAFLWYIMNRSNDIPQVEHNKNMWDSRYNARKNDVQREGPRDWNDWYNSKRNENEELVNSFTDMDAELYPILQFTRSGGNLYVKFPAQRYFKPKATNSDNARYRLNASIYRFNWEYLQNIKILKPKVILYQMFDGLLNGLLSLSLSIRPTLNRKEIFEQLSTAIKKYIEADDTEVEDCYFTFSNEEFDSMLNDMLLARYNATYGGGEVNRAVTHDINDYLSQLDTVNFSSQLAGDTTKITKIVTEVATAGGQEGSVEWGLEWNIDPNWWKKLVILLFLINFDIMGIVSLEDLFSTDQSMIVRIIMNKIFAMLRQIILLIKDKLIELLWRLFEKVVLPLVLKYQLLKIREQIEDWIILLSSIIYCLPRFKFQKALTQIDDVNYADITNEQTLPESVQKC